LIHSRGLAIANHSRVETGKRQSGGGSGGGGKGQSGRAQNQRDRESISDVQHGKLLLRRRLTDGRKNAPPPLNAR
jgi:hypothetical protein